MVHAKFNDQWIRFLKFFFHTWAWRQSWSRDLDHLYKLSFARSKEAPLTGQAISERRCLNIVDGQTDNND